MVMAAEGDNVAFCGTGFICHRSGYVLTCAHILNLTAKLSIVPAQPINQFSPRTLTRVNTIPVVIAQFDAVHDVAMLKITVQVTAAIPTNWMGRGETIAAGTSVGCLEAVSTNTVSCWISG